MLVFQMILNTLGSVDILPFTGVTFPFVSKGGSSLISCWGLLAFIKAADTRQNASFVVKMPKRPSAARNGKNSEFRIRDPESMRNGEGSERSPEFEIWSSESMRTGEGREFE